MAVAYTDTPSVKKTSTTKEEKSSKKGKEKK